jgi:hypothetical protein
MNRRTRDLAEQTWFVDVSPDGGRGVFACPVFETPPGLVIVDPGPPAWFDALMEGLSKRGYRLADVVAVLLTGTSALSIAGTLFMANRNRRIRLLGPARVVDMIGDIPSLEARLERTFRDRPDLLAAIEAFEVGERVELLRVDDRVGPGGRMFRLRRSALPGALVYHDEQSDILSGGIGLGGIVVGKRGRYLPTAVRPSERLTIDAIAAVVDSCAPKAVFMHHFGLVGPDHFQSHPGDARTRVTLEPAPPDIEPFLRLV